MKNNEDLAARLLYRDALMLILDKPAGLAVHAAGRGEDHLGRHLDALRFGLPRAPELAHRLDRETSGCLVLGRHRQALKRLGTLFAEGKVEKTYWAVAVGDPGAESGLIDLPLSNSIGRRAGQVAVDEAGQPSRTEWRMLGRGEGTVWLECRPLTGRTHQIRVHLAASGFPILGDSLYGRSAPGGLHLHARSIAVPLYRRKPAVTAVAPVPAHMKGALLLTGWTDG